MHSTQPTRSLLNVLPPLAGSGAASVGSGLLHTLLPLRLSRLGFETDAIGIVVTAYSVGFLIGCLGVPLLIRSVGHVRANAAFAAVTALTILLLDWDPSPWATALLVGTTGASASGMAVVTESWLNELVPTEWRGRVLTAYILELALCYGLGQLVGLYVDVGSSHMPVVAASCYILALIPVAVIDVAGPKPPQAAKLRLLHAFHVSPVGALSCLQTGLITGTFAGIGPLYGEALGLDQRSIVLLMASVQLGGLALQWPLGLMSDRCDRRQLLIGMSFALMAIAGALIFAGGRLPLYGLMALFGCFGGVSESFYPIGVAHSNDRADPSEYVPLSSNLLLLWAIGSAVGPIAGSSAMKHIGPGGFFWYVLALAFAFAAYTLWRMRRAARAALEMREEFVAYPTSSPAIFEWIPFRKLRRAAPPPDTTPDTAEEV